MSTVVKKRPGRPPAVLGSEIVSALRDLPIFDEQGKLKKIGDEVWDTGVERLQMKIQKYNLYYFVLQDRQGSLRQLYNIRFACEKVQEEQPKCKKSQKKPITYDLKSNILDSLLDMKFNVEYRFIIKEITAHPFQIIYSLPEFRNVCLKRAKENALFLVMRDEVCKKVMLHGQESGNLTLYSVVSNDGEGTILPYFHVLTSDKDEDNLRYIWYEWMRLTYPIPEFLFVPAATKYVESAAEVFNSSNKSNYLNQCHAFIARESSILPGCIINVDLVLNTTVMAKYFGKNVNLAVIEFYKRCIYRLSLVDCKDDFEAIVIAILVLLQSTVLDASINETRAKLLKDLKSQEIANFLQMKSDDSYEEFNLFEDSSCVDLQNYITELNQRALEYCNSSDDKNIWKEANPYYNVEFVNPLLHLLTYYPIWTNTINHLSKSFKYNKLFGTSSEYFNSVSFSDVEVDEFVFKHIALQKQQFFNISAIFQHKSSEQQQGMHSFLQEKENWKGKQNVELDIDSAILDQVDTDHDTSADDSNLSDSSHRTSTSTSDSSSHNSTDSDKKQPKSKRRKVINPAYYIDEKIDMKKYLKSIQNNELKGKFKSRTIANGNIKPYFNYVFEDTSTFDSIVELLTRTIYYNQNFRQFCLEEGGKGNDFLQLIIRYSSGAKLKEIYASRLTILKKMNCKNSNVVIKLPSLIVLFEKLMGNSSSIKELRFCDRCPMQALNKEIFSIKFNKPIKGHKLHKLQKYVNQELQDYDCHENCNFCKEKITIKREIETYLALNFEECDDLYDINNLPLQIAIQSKNFTLAGLIRILTPPKYCTLMESICYVRNFKSWKAYKNTEIKPIKKPNTKSVKIGMVIYARSD